MLRFDSMPNFRQLGDNSLGFVDEGDGKNLARIQLYRSSRPDFLTAQEIEQFCSAKIRSIIDFRSVKEYSKSTGPKLLDEFYPVYKVKLPFKLQYKPGDEVASVPLKAKWPHRPRSSVSEKDRRLGKHFFIDFFKINYIWAVFNRAPWYIRLYSLLFLIVDLIFNTGYRFFVRVFSRHVLNQEGLLGQYCDMINYSQASICAALKLLTDPENVPAMLNCAHGKDRTGIVSALVLGCLGKSKDEIAEDYARSEVELQPMQARLENEIIDRFHMCRTFISAKAETMAQVLDYIENNYGNITNYLESIGFTLRDQEVLKKNLTSSP